MKILEARVENFASYKSLNFKFNGVGLALISGDTGSGKSTLCDIVPWVLFGRTAKNGAVDDIKAWNSEETIGHIIIEDGTKMLSVTRIRGDLNDLYFKYDSEEPIRGKDLIDTQKLLNEILGMNLDIYLSSSYFHEFSNIASFFITTAKTRRQITEQIVDLSLAKTLTEKLTSSKKMAQKDVDIFQDKVKVLTTIRAYASKQYEDYKINSKNHKIKITNEIDRLTKLSANFEADKEDTLEKLYQSHYLIESGLKEEIKDLEDSAKSVKYFTAKKDAIKQKIEDLGSSVCASCGGTIHGDTRLLLTRELNKLQSEEAKNDQFRIQIINKKLLLDKHNNENSVSLRAIKKEMDRENTYLEQLSKVRLDENPFEQLFEEKRQEIDNLVNELSAVESNLQKARVRFSDLELLLNVINDFRTLLVKNAVLAIQESTNKLLSKYFDAEIRVEFEAENADKLDVTITKDGNRCVYAQLSKGQRQLLKLCFGVSVMQAITNHHGMRVNVAFFDEALDGLDDSLKVKAFTLLQSLELEYESIFVVEHNEHIKPLFTTEFHVDLVNGHSEITEI